MHYVILLIVILVFLAFAAVALPFMLAIYGLLRFLSWLVMKAFGIRRLDGGIHTLIVIVSVVAGFIIMTQFVN